MCCLHLDGSNNYSQQLGEKRWELCRLRRIHLHCSPCARSKPHQSLWMSVGFGSGPRLLLPLLRSYSGRSPIEVSEIIPRYNRAHCQEDFNDIQPTFSMSSYHPIIPSYASLSSFFWGPNPNLTQAKLALTSIKEAGSRCHLYCSEAAVMPPPWCHHIGKPCMVFLLVKTTVLSLWQYWRGEKNEKICQYNFKPYSNMNF